MSTTIKCLLPSLDCAGELAGGSDGDVGDGAAGVLGCCEDSVCVGDSVVGAAAPLC
ncbi:MAG: hypothetical protein FWH33_10880 [Oscillospiraceae bacterium]|nr:hypothetical protein [Oscillospiraceae bacterium]